MMPDASNAPAGFERHFLGRFGETVIAYLGREARIGKIFDDDVFLVVDAIELGDNPFDEEIGVEFHTSKTPPAPGYVPHWGRFTPGQPVEHILKPRVNFIESETRLSFVFTSEIPFKENVDQFLDFLRLEIGMIPGEQHATRPEVEEQSPSDEIRVAPSLGEALNPDVAKAHPGQQTAH
jgi:hypothetical protein